MMIWESLLIALSMYSAIPVPQVEWQENNMRWSLGFLPIVGLLAAGLTGLWSWLALSSEANPIFFGAVAVLLPILLAGGFHMDGFLDAADGIFSRRDREKRLQIMKDPHCGPFAVTCCGGLLLIELGAWCQLISQQSLLPTACTVFLLSRSLAVTAGSRFPYTASSTLGALFAGRAAKGVSTLGIVETAFSLALLIAAGWIWGGVNGLLITIVTGLGVLLLFLWYRRYTIKQFGGITGDLLGFWIELSQMFMLSFLAFGSLII